jgi:Flp pilus assembly pilin Flp
MQFKRRCHREDGQTVIEYAFVVALVSITTLAILAGAANGWIATITAQVTDALS